MARRRRNPVDTKDFLFLAMVAGGLYLAYKAFSGLKNLGKGAAAALNTVGSNIGSGLFDYVNPGAANASGTDIFYTVKFPDGTSHAIDPTLLNQDNQFMYGTASYQLGTNASGQHIATQVTPSTYQIPDMFGITDTASW